MKSREKNHLKKKKKKCDFIKYLINILIFMKKAYLIYLKIFIISYNLNQINIYCIKFKFLKKIVTRLIYC